MGCCCCHCRCCRPLSARAMDALWLSAVLWELLHDDRSALWAVRVPGTELELGGRGARGAGDVPVCRAVCLHARQHARPCPRRPRVSVEPAACVQWSLRP